MANDESKLRSIKFKIEENSQEVNKIVDSIVNKYGQQLDDEINKIKDTLDNADTISDTEVENLVMRLPIFMYYSANGIETLGVESDMAKAVKAEVYNEKYMVSEGSTIKDKQAETENMIINESMMEVAFSRAYKKLKTKLDQAEHVFSGAKKVLSKRMQDVELTRNDKYQ